jgi:hypothetical protein
VEKNRKTGNIETTCPAIRNPKNVRAAVYVHSAQPSDFMHLSDNGFAFCLPSETPIFGDGRRRQGLSEDDRRSGRAWSLRWIWNLMRRVMQAGILP